MISKDSLHQRARETAARLHTGHSYHAQDCEWCEAITSVIEAALRAVAEETRESCLPWMQHKHGCTALSPFAQIPLKWEPGLRPCSCGLDEFRASVRPK